MLPPSSTIETTRRGGSSWYRRCGCIYLVYFACELRPSGSPQHFVDLLPGGFLFLARLLTSLLYLYFLSIFLSMNRRGYSIFSVLVKKSLLSILIFDPPPLPPPRVFRGTATVTFLKFAYSRKHHLWHDMQGL